MSTGRPAKCTGMMAFVLGRDRGFNLVEIDIAAGEIYIDEYRLRADPHDHIRRWRAKLMPA